MTKHLCWAGFALVLSMALGACSKVENCKVGSAGCKGGAPIDGKTCKFGLVLKNGMCVEPGSTGDGDGDGDAGQPDAGGPECKCDDPQALCIVANECVNYCEVPDMLPGGLAKTDQDPRPKTPVFCVKAKNTDPDLTFDEVCKRRCLLQCERYSWFCGAKIDTCQATCESADVKAACTADIATCAAGDASKNISCLQQSCQGVKSTGCLDTMCPGNKAPNCTGVKCTNNADKCTANFDGFCDDGDTFFTKPNPASNVETDSNLCAWGTDCADCGPRKGMDNSVNLPLGAPCLYNSACAGNIQVTVNHQTVTDLARTEAWCVEISEVAVGNFRCVHDISGKDEHCTTGFKPQDLYGADTNGDGQPDKITMGTGANMLSAKVCVPESCK